MNRFESYDIKLGTFIQFVATVLKLFRKEFGFMLFWVKPRFNKYNFL